jgi:hypothetical protein
MRDTILPAPVQAAIRRQCPLVSIQAFEDALDGYRFANILAPPIPASERRAVLERIADLSQGLWEALGELAMTERSKLHGKLSKGRKSGKLPRAFFSHLSRAAREVADDIQPAAGRPLDRKAYVIRDIARELRRCDYPVDASSKGPLVSIASDLFSLIEDAPQDVRSLVRNALAKIDLETLSFYHDSPP